ncbi:hypothetical protein [Kineobactrum salinum]|uniref:Tetratricopeptide repeat protein n=1 Tax=Kineobactrum salinum TaxID=2708301 RepID=A0A6C0UA44_9GAMM|nr:hypothetical protein [Kineobactrum salinum]QIB66624.1 hypothetical protein G3T16_15740 [Kineobactrum salinum]
MAGFCLLLAAFLIYANNAGNYLLFDDTPALTGNERVQLDGSRFDDWRVAAFSSDAGPLGRPLTMASFALQHVVEGGFSPVSLKVTNAVIHCLIAALLYGLFSSILGQLSAQGRSRLDPRWTALAAMALWLLHPLQVSTVLYTVQRMAQLSTLFVVLGLWLFVRYRARWTVRGASTAEVIAAVLWLLLVGAAAILCKENGALLFWLLPAVEVAIFRGRWAGREVPGLALLGWLLLLLPLLLIALLFIWYPELFHSGYRIRDFTMEERLLTQLRLLWRYLGWLLWPNILDMGFQHDYIPLSRGLLQPVATLMALLSWSLLLALALWQRQRWPLLLFAVLFYLIAHSMESSFLALEMVYEHRNYLPSVAVCLLLAAALGAVVGRLPVGRSVFVAVAGLFVLATLLALRAHTWSDDLRLSRVNVARHPESVRSNYFYANALLREYRLREERGHDVQSAQEMLAVGRHYMELMHQQDRRDLGALVMLYYLDSSFFPELLQRTDWLGDIRRALEGRVLKPSDRNALALLAECMGNDQCATPAPVAREFLRQLRLQYPELPDPVALQYNWLVESGAGAAELIPLLEEGIERWPGQQTFYPQLIHQYDRVGDAAGIYRTLEQWLRVDPKRYQLSLQRRLFARGSE